MIDMAVKPKPTLKQLVFLAQNRIEAALNNHGAAKSCVSCSFGKDSMVVLHLVRVYAPDIQVMFNNTGVEYPDTLKFRDRILKEWDLNYTEVHPKKTFWELKDKYGWPDRRFDGKKGQHTVPCYHYLKELPAAEFWAKEKIQLVFDGLTASESHARWMLAYRCGGGPYYYARSIGVYKSHPILDWPADIVGKYIKRYNVLVNPHYTKFPDQRVGCMSCTGFLDWRENMAKAFPAMYRKIQKERGQKLLEEYAAEVSKL